MDTFIDNEPTESISLSYDETVSYEEQISIMPIDETMAARGSTLAGRISANKVYVPPSEIFSSGKRKREEEDEEGKEDEEDNGMSDGITRPNALVLSGSPISRLPTGRIFGYAKHFKLAPVALEWIDDTSCVLVFSSNSARQEAQTVLSSSRSNGDTQTMDLDEEGYTVARSVPAPLWPPEERINRSLGVGEGLKGVIRMRVARLDDVKKRGARNNSDFYRKHGLDAGKDPANVVLRTERKSGEDAVDLEEKRRKLDEELDDFLAHDDDEAQNVEGAESATSDDPGLSRRLATPDPDEDYNTPVVSRMRADAIDAEVRSRGHPRKRTRTSLGDRLSKSSSQMNSEWRSRLGQSPDEDLDVGLSGDKDRTHFDRGRNDHSRRRRRGGRGRAAKGGSIRPVVTAQQLDDELEAFLSGQ